jgi:hypothetical protein
MRGAQTTRLSPDCYALSTGPCGSDRYDADLETASFGEGERAQDAGAANLS